MKIFTQFFLGFASFLTASAEITNNWEVRLPEARIVGGFESRPHSHPYMVSLQTRFLWVRAHFCGGSLLNKYWILTAGHCVKESWIIQWLPMDAVAGVHNVDHFESNTQIVSIGERITHPLYEGGIGAHDIAVLKTKKPFVLTKEIRPINLPQANFRLVKGEAMSLSGWGLLRTTMFIPDLPSRLQEVKVNYMTYKDCHNAVEAVKEDNEENPLVEESNICTGPIKGGIAACNGDSGGPLVLYATRKRFSASANKTVAIKDDEIDEIDNEIDSYEEEYFERKSKPNKQKKDDDVIPTVFGVVSWGISPCGQKGAPTVYTKVIPHLDFINSLIHTGLGI